MPAWPTPWPAALSRVVCAIPHPDDEVFAAGLLCAAADAGATVGIVCATRGELGFVHGRRVPTNEIRAIRAAELEASAAALGALPPIHLERPDAGFGHQDGDAEDLAAALAAFGPDLVVSYGADGGYGHRDHVALHRMLAAMATDAPWRWLRLAFDPTLFEAFAESLRRARPSLFLERPPSRVGPPSWSLKLSERQRRVKRAVIAAHASQLDRGGAFVFDGLIEAILDAEEYDE